MFLYRSKKNKNYSCQCHKMSHLDLEHLPRITLQQQISKNNSVKSPSISSYISQDDTPAHLNKEEDIKNKETTTTRC